MSNETPPTTEAGSDPDTTRGRAPARDRLRSFITAGDGTNGREAVVDGCGLVALVAVSVGVGLDVLANLPFDPVAVPPTVRAVGATGVPVAVAFAVVTVPFVAERATVRVGLLFAGVFGALSIASRAATVPAVVAVTIGGAVALLGANGLPSGYRSLRRRLVAAGFLGGIAVSLSGAVGMLDGSARGVGGLLALGAATAMAVRVERDRVAALAGGLGFGAAVAVSAASPFIVGSALLVAFAISGVPYLLVACAVGGATAATVAGLRRADRTLAIGAPLVLLAGVPTTVPRALAVLLGAVLVLVDVGAAPDGAPTGDDDSTSVEGVRA